LKEAMVMEENKIVSKKNRGRIVYIPISFIREIFGGRMLADDYDGEGYINVPVLDDIPGDAELVFIMAFPERDAIGLKFIHESFEETLEGNCFPEVVLGEITFRKVKVE
jgi:hypothetical protein